jgi:hypothetical protein
MMPRTKQMPTRWMSIELARIKSFEHLLSHRVVCIFKDGCKF